ncbi:hypothetical protein [Xylophilus sp.]|uniref:hypothetical protein n=1 Tax=Xylophilus sp. TaxID=2653893 RepID=UPI0013B76B9F|nr:hypothetical protein [Xylophilus sp.]KAF1046206.1 MAG: hypothetical protein GAK38_02603 [Xylophilus sp.]
MKRSEAEHALRAAAAIAQEQSFVVVGSQAVLLSHPHAPDELLVSRELDLYPALHPEKADLIDGAGAMSSFHETSGYHADGVGRETAIMSADWQDRAQLHYVGEEAAVCPEIHDLAVSKCVAGRDKDGTSYACCSSKGRWTSRCLSPASGSWTQPWRRWMRLPRGRGAASRRSEP